MNKTKRIFAIAVTVTTILWSMGPAAVLALAVDTVVVTPTAVEVTFNDGVQMLTGDLTGAIELGDSTTAANDLRNYLLKTGSPLVTRVLSRYQRYDITTENFDSQKTLYIYGLKSSNLSLGDAWSFGINADTIRHVSSTDVYVDAVTETGVVVDSNDPIINTIVNSETGADCEGYPCGLKTEQIIISGSNYTATTKVYFDGDKEAAVDAWTTTQITTTVPNAVDDLGKVTVSLEDANTGRKSATREFVSIGATAGYGVAVGKLTLDDDTAVDRAEVRINKPYYWGGEDTGTTQADGKFAVALSESTTYEAKFVTPANCSEAAPSKVGSIVVTLGAVTNIGTKKFKTPTISGYVKEPTTEGDDPLYGVEVRVFTYDWTVEQRAISGTDGAWKIYIDNTGSSPVNVGVETDLAQYHQYRLDYRPVVQGQYDQTLWQGDTVTGLNLYLTKINVSGTIKTPVTADPDTNPSPLNDDLVPNANIQLHSQDWSYNQWTQTDSSGNFQFGGAPAGSTYVLEIEAPGSGDYTNYSRTTITGLVIGASATGYNSGTGITSLNQDEEAVSSALRFSSPSVWGEVKAGGSALENAWVELRGVGGAGSWFGINTDAAGKFKFGGVAIGTYELEINPPGGSTYSNRRFENIQITSTTANDLKDQADAIDGIDDDAFTLAAPNVSGYVYGPTLTTGQNNVWVDLCPYSGPGNCYGDSTDNNDSGLFGIGGVPDNIYRLELYVDSWSTAYVAPAAKTLVISGGSPSTLDGVAVSGNLILRLADPADGGLTGKVCAPGDSADCEHAQGNVGVNLRPQNAMEGFQWGQTNSAGEFGFGDIDAGTYDLEVEPWGSADYSRKLYTITINSDDTVTVGSTTYNDRNIRLFLSSPNVTGYVYTPVFAAGHTSTSNPTPNIAVQNAWINLHQEGPMMGGGGWYNSNTNESGKFTFGGVQPGSNYVLEVEGSWGGAYTQKRYTGITFTDIDSDGTADECSVGPDDDGDATDGSCDLSTLLGTATSGTPAMAIRVGIPNLRGQVVDPADAGVRDCWIMVHDSNWMNQAGGNTDQNGNFNLGGLSNGTYQIEINMPWGGNGQAYTTPSGLTVVIANDIATIKKNGVALTNNKITLETPKKILTGVITRSSDSSVVTDARVEAHRDMGGGFFETRTDSNGKYTLKISGGEWWVEVRPDWGSTQPDWVYSDPPTRISFPETSTLECKGTLTNCQAADATVVAGNVIAVGLDFEVATANCTLNGIVKDPSGNAVTNTWVDAHKGMGPGNGQQTDNNGRFSIKVPAGTYEIMVMPNDPTYGSPDPIKAKVAEVSSGVGGTTDVGTIYLKARNSHIKGSVTDSAGNAIGNVMVNAWQMGAMGWANAFTDSTTGAYDLTLSAGTWGVMIMPMSGDYIYQGAPLNVTVEDDKTSSGNNFVLKIADTTLKVSIKDSSGNRITDFWGGVWVKDTSVNDMLDFGGPMDDMMEKGGMMDSGGDMTGGAMGPGMEQGGFQGGGLVNGYTEIKVPGGSEDSPEEYELGLHSPPGSQYTLSATKTVSVVSGTDQEIDLTVTLNDATIQGYLYIDADSDGAYDSGEEISGIRAFIHADRTEGGWQMTESNSDGSYSLTLCAGDWYLDAFIDVFMAFGGAGSRYMIINEDVTVGAIADTSITYNFQVKELDATITGTITGPDDATMDNVWVFVDYGSAEMISDFKGPGGPGMGVMTDIDGNYSLAVAGGTYKVGAGIPPWDSRDLISPDLLEVIVADSGTSTGNNLAFAESDATITGTITYGGNAKAAFVRAWSDDGGGTGAISTDGSYELKVSSGNIWYVVAATEISDVYYESDTGAVNTVVGANTLGLVLVETSIAVPEAKTSSFGADSSKSIILADGLTVEVPAASIKSSGTITVTVTPKTDAQPDSKDKPLGIAYDFVVKDADGKEVTSFVSDVKITIPYNESVITAAGYSETDLTPKYYDDTTGAWGNYKAVVQDTENNTFTITTDHFTPGGLTGGRVTAADTGDTTTGTGTTGAGPGAGSGVTPTGPSDISVSVNFGAETTGSRTVTLSLNATNSAEMLISNNADFTGATWEAYASLKYWTLTAGSGEKYVYAKFRDTSYNTSSITSGVITLHEAVAVTLEKDLVKTADSSAVYLVLNGKRHVFPHLAVYQSWAYPADFSIVKTVSSADFDSYAEGDPVPFRDGNLFRGTAESLHGHAASAVFYVEDAKLRPVQSAEIYQTLFSDEDWGLVTWVPDDLLTKFAYPLGELIASSDTHPNGCLVKYADSAAVYLIENGQKRPFTSSSALVANGYAERKIFTISATETYEEASSINALAEILITPVIAAAFRK